MVKKQTNKPNKHHEKSAHMLLDPSAKIPYSFWRANICPEPESFENLAYNRHDALKGIWCYISKFKMKILKLQNGRAAGFALRFISDESPVFIAYKIKSSVVMKPPYSKLRVVLGTFKMCLFVHRHCVLWGFFLSTFIFCKKGVFSVFEERCSII